MTELMQAHRQWMSRAPDERFTSLLDMQDFKRRVRDNSRSQVISSRGLTVRPVEDDHRALQIMGYGSGLPTAAPTHWSFGQLCNLASPGNSPASYFRETQMPAPIIVRARLPGIDQRLAEQVVRFVQLVRREGLEKTPGIAETLDWARALVGLDIGSIDEDPAAVQASLICLLKTEADLKRVPKEIAARLIGQVA